MPVGKIAASGLAAAFKDVAGDDTGRNLVPIGEGPAEFVDHRRDGNAGVGDPAGDDDVWFPLQRFYDWGRAKVNVRGFDPRFDVAKWLARFHVFERAALGDQLAHAVDDVVAIDDGDFDLQAQPAGQGFDGLSAGFGVDAASIGDDPGLVLNQLGEDAFEHRQKVARVASIRIALALLLHDRHRDLGEEIHRDVIKTAAVHLPVQRFGVVAPVAAGVADS